MVRLVISVFLLFVSTIGFSQTAGNEDLKKTNAYIRFEPEEYNLGVIEVNEVNENTGNIEINVTNDGAKPLILNSVTGCCGTDVKDWTKQPIMPGKSGTIKVYFRVEPRPSRISRTVTVKSNAANGAQLKVAIFGEVVLKRQTNEIDLP
ncbi:MAG TPA: DUF1573 domain-containing protein [Tenuifilaceae bacterium]|nr:DUF1573 domain-containing protein [Tenuifilaceae bacterium]HPE18949.1 DUF1573 domain-containing protein [Tenuifilaceae bacterium]HPJ46416.1 DUF1573 domain-containing protein [Tenuifilaceae bacterium]HPQ34593.1 DUF1573 domain-containing protein [Tenuifilaceae bacterium]HRX67437.1 DUF1573 domain-containing protein [Tenuifilaceae bacterium]